MRATRPKEEKDKGEKRKGNDEQDKSNKKNGSAADEAETQSLSQALAQDEAEEAIVSQERAHLFINLVVQDSNGDNAIQYKMKPTSVLKKLMENYSTKRKVAEKSIRFLYDGKRINTTDTPERLKMEDNDIIEVMMKQDGGGGGLY